MFSIKSKKKYGLQTGRAGAGFGAAGNDEEEDEDEMSLALERETAAKRAKAAREQAEQLMEEDPSVYDYDNAYDDIQETRKQERQQKRSGPSESKYISKLKQKADERQAEREKIMERKIQKEQEQEAHLYEDKEKFVTSAYKKKLQERKRQEEEEKEREEHEEESEITGKKDMNQFYYNLMSRNVATGAKPQEEGAEKAEGSLRGGQHTEKHGTVGKDTDAAESKKASKFDEKTPRWSEEPQPRNSKREVIHEEDPEPKKETSHERAVRLNQHRNDDAAIEAARQRYFQRQAARAHKTAGVR